MKNVLLIAFVSLLQIFTYANAAPSHTEISIGDDKIVAENVHETNKEMKYSYDITYPQLTGKNLTYSAKAFNAEIKNMVDHDIVPLKQNAASPATIEAQKGINKLNMLKADYDVAVINPSDTPLISVRFKVYLQAANEKAPTVFHEMFNYNLKTGDGKSITLESLFIPNSDYEKVLSDYYAKRLEKIKGVTKTNVEEVMTNPPEFSFRPDGLLLTFDDLPVKIGPKEVLVPYPVLKDVVSIYSPITICTTKPEECKK